MNRLSAITLSTLVAFGITACSSHKTEAPVKAEPVKKEAAVETQDIRIITVANSDGKITGATIEDAFTANGFMVDGNNDMNKPFSLRFGKDKLWYKTYRLAVVHHQDLTAKLAKDYPSIGLLTPLSMSIWSSNDNKDISISSLTLRGMSRITHIPMDNPDLIAYADAMDKSLKAAVPGGKYEDRKYSKVADMKMQLATLFTTTFDTDEETTAADAKDSFEEEFEAEMEPVGFLFPSFIDLNGELEERGVTTYDYYDTYSVCKLEVIHPISKTHPEVGAFAPCTFFVYKKKGETTTHMGYPSIDNWITATDIEDEASMRPLVDAQELFSNIVLEITE
ncbi:MAG: DUF302 domain-containing protein [Sulfurimonadaceae bacterium]